MTEIEERALAITNLIDSDLERTAAARRDEADAKIHWERTQEEVGNLITRKQIETRSLPEVAEATDPALDQKTPEFVEGLVSTYIQEDEEYQQAWNEYFDAKQAYEEARIEHVTATERLGAHKSQAKLLAALIEHGSG